MIPMGHGISSVLSRHPFAMAVERLEAVVLHRGLSLAARVDHSEDAVKAGLQMRPTVLLIFGNPRAGTPLMVASPSLAIDLPLKALVWQDEEQRVWVSYNTTEYLRERHQIPEELVQKIAGLPSICEEAAG
jgi:uncharacterized protein (DUF302 family)